ncbi:hypothetical protein ACHAW5_007179 [Stephanodiscus triporus]|uniref:Cytochrome P450 n=1 Tax=Stephanodiscus triporus TaxID=2934178 RepID=A0ABD3NZF3_9STRA
MYSEYGDVYMMSIMGEDEYVLCDPIAFDAVLRREGKFPIGASESVIPFKEYYDETNNTLGKNSMSHGPEWREWRRSMEADMYAEWEVYLPAIADAASRISKVAGYEVTERVDNIAFEDFLSRSAFDMFSSVMYGESPRTTDSDVVDPADLEFVTSTQAAFELTGRLLFNPLEKVFGGDIYRSFKINMDRTFAFGSERTAKYISRVTEEEQREAGAKEDRGGATGGGEGNDAGNSGCPVTAVKNGLVGRLVNRGRLSVEDVQSMSGPLLMAGVDTTAYVMSWLFLNLASNPAVQTRLAEELRTVLDGADVTTAKQMQDLPYLKACIRESHRLTPTSAMMTKTLHEDVDVDVDGMAYRIPAGRRISLNLRAYPMDPRYVDDPTSYVPERFLPDAVRARSGTMSGVALDHPAFADPFGRGKRRCTGSNLAIAEITVLAARMVQDYEISFADPKRAMWRPRQRLMLKADPYPDIKLVRRVSS